MEISLKLTLQQKAQCEAIRPGCFEDTHVSLEEEPRLDRHGNRNQSYKTGIIFNYTGTHDDFFSRWLALIKASHYDNVGGIIRPHKYNPDDVRLEWDENLETYLFNRGWWEEFTEEYRPGNKLHFVPQRFTLASAIERLWHLSPDEISECLGVSVDVVRRYVADIEKIDSRSI